MKIQFLEAAQSEFEEAIDFYNQQRTGLGIEFADEVDKPWSALGIILKLGRHCLCESAVVW